MKISAQLFDDVRALQEYLLSNLSANCKAIVLFTLGMEISDFTDIVKQTPDSIKVFLADCYGILGYSQKEGKNIELMEAGRGREYGAVGGDGGSGVVCVAFHGDEFSATTDVLPGENVTSHMCVASVDSNMGSFLSKNAKAPYYGGIAKAAYVYDRTSKGFFNKIPYFFISTICQEVGITSFTANVSDKIAELLEKLPSDKKIDAVALFPCFMRGKNFYGKNNVESNTLGEFLTNVPVFGMFCHGEFGPSKCLSFYKEENQNDSCASHSMTSIVAMYTA